jgi:hypothetical protein
MKGLRYLMCGVALVASAGASTATAATWDPVNSNISTTNVGSLTFTAGGASYTCNTVTLTLRAASGTASVAVAQGTHNPVAFSNCTSFLGSATVTTTGTWQFTANSTTSVTMAAVGATVLQMRFHAVPSCTINIPGFDLPNNTWSNSTHQLTLNSTATFAVTSTAGCLGAVGSTGSFSSTFSAPTATIT